MGKMMDAVAMVISCGEEILIIERQPFLKAFPGYWAFPGGKVEEVDKNFIPNSFFPPFEKKLLGALVREALEELGVDLVEMSSRGEIESVQNLGVAVTPDFNPHRFLTTFFRIHFSSRPTLNFDHNEVLRGHWMRPSELFSWYEKGQVLAVPPVIKIIENLSQNPFPEMMEDINFVYDQDRFVPCIESVKGVKQLMPLSHTLPPATRTNAFLIGDKIKILIDPSPKSLEEFEKLKNTINLFGVDKILLTHHHGDHHERSNDLARDYQVPILLSRYTFHRMTQKNPHYFDDIQVAFLKEEDIITSGPGGVVKVMEIPGHDEGQLGLYSEDLAWFIAGDLFQGVGTVVIGGEEGDMKKYFHTLERVIKLSPKVLFPSHGIGLGGTWILEKTLKHRKERESEVLLLTQKGKTPQEILELIYSDVDPKLWPYAMENIQKHLVKLKEEGSL